MGTILLRELLARLADFLEGEPSYTAFRPINAQLDLNTKMDVIRLEPFDSYTPSGYKYFIEPFIMAEVVEALESFLLRKPTIEEMALAVIHYAEHDSYISLEELRKHVPAPIGFTFKEQTIVHKAAVWKEQAESAIYIDCGGEHFPGVREELPIRRISENRVQLCCVPFLAGFALGDTLALEEYEGSLGWFRRKSLGHNTHRFLFKYAAEEAREAVITELHRRGELFEWYSPDYLAVNRADPAGYGYWIEFFERMRREYGVLYV